MLTLFTDSDTDITKQKADELGFKLISMPYTIDGQLVYPYEDWDTFDAHTFYGKLRSGVLPTTSSISEERYIKYFEPEFEKGNDIFYVHFSRAMTTTFNAMDSAVAKLQAKYPERKFYEVDTKAITILSYLIILEIADLFKSGKSPEEVIKWADQEINHYAVYFFADDLKFFAHSGRVSGLAGTMGTLLGIRPIIHIDTSGKMVNVDKVKGRMKAVSYLVDKLLELGDHPEKYRIVLASADSPALIDAMKNMLHEKLGADLQLEIVDVNPTAGSHCGPDTVGIAFHSKTR